MAEGKIDLDIQPMAADLAPDASGLITESAS